MRAPKHFNLGGIREDVGEGQDPPTRRTSGVRKSTVSCRSCKRVQRCAWMATTAECGPSGVTSFVACVATASSGWTSMTCLYWTFMSLCRDQTRQVLQMSGGRIVSYGKIADDFADAECPSVCSVHMNIHSRNVPIMYACVCVCVVSNFLASACKNAYTHRHAIAYVPVLFNTSKVQLLSPLPSTPSPSPRACHDTDILAGSCCRSHGDHLANKNHFCASVAWPIVAIAAFHHVRACW